MKKNQKLAFALIGALKALIILNLVVVFLVKKKSVSRALFALMGIAAAGAMLLHCSDNIKGLFAKSGGLCCCGDAEDFEDYWEDDFGEDMAKIPDPDEE